jgi:hypothetical protein
MPAHAHSVPSNQREWDSLLAELNAEFTTALTHNSIARSVLRPSRNQYIFKGHAGHKVSIPTFEVSVSTRWVSDWGPEVRALERKLVSLISEFKGLEDGHLLQILDAVDRRATEEPGYGLVHREALDRDRLLSESVKDIKESGLRVSHIFFNPYDYLLVRRGRDEFLAETRRAKLVTGLMGYYDGAEIRMSRKVKAGAVLVFGSRSEEAIANDPDVLDLVMVIHKEPVIEMTKEGEFTVLSIKEEIGMAAGGAVYTQKVLIPPKV